jgi:hypothetical protein
LKSPEPVWKAMSICEVRKSRRKPGVGREVAANRFHPARCRSVTEWTKR